MEEVIIYGYSSIGEAVYQECIRRGDTVVCFCEDSNIRKDKARTKEDIFSLYEIIGQGLQGKFILCIPDVEPVIQKLEKAGYKDWALVTEYLSDGNYQNDVYTIKSRGTAIREIESCIFSHRYLGMPDKLFLRNVDLEITERCSMRCRDCCNLMQYYKKPKDYPLEELIKWLDELLKYVDEIYEIRILGGEPFMHRDIHRIVGQMLPHPQIHRILIITNATIMPSEEMWESMQHEKVGFSITDYGKLSRNLLNMQRELDRREIVYDIHEMGGWTQCSNISAHGRNGVELREIYQECCAKNLITLLDGRIYKCPYIANAVNLKAIPDMEGEYVDLKTLKGMDLAAAKKVMRSYIKEKDCFLSCDYCDGRSFDAEEIEPAIQISEPRSYVAMGETVG